MEPVFKESICLMEQTLLIFMPSGGELGIIFFAILLLFGGQKIPELMRGIGRGIREFNDARDSVKKSLEEGIREAEAQERKEKEKGSATGPQTS